MKAYALNILCEIIYLNFLERYNEIKQWKRGWDKRFSAKEKPELSCEILI